ncbi:MAG: hypothetical protein ACLVFD_02900 [Anaerostipes hadrus]
MTQEKVFSDTFSTTALAVYDEFESAEALANMDLHELTDFIIEKGKNRFPDPGCSSQSHTESCPQFLPFTQNGK